MGAKLCTYKDSIDDKKNELIPSLKIPPNIQEDNPSNNNKGHSPKDIVSEHANPHNNFGETNKQFHSQFISNLNNSKDDLPDLKADDNANISIKEIRVSKLSASFSPAKANKQEEDKEFSSKQKQEPVHELIQSISIKY